MKFTVITYGMHLLILIMNMAALAVVHRWRRLRLLEPSATVGWNQ
jgi:hypothetical protein